MKPLLLCITATAAACLGGQVMAAKAHEHGVVRLDVVVEAQRVTVEIDTPLDNIVGFERAPRTDAERARVAAAVKLLQDAGKLFRIDSAAGCTPGKVELTSAPLQLGAAAPAAAKDGHADFEGRFEFVCTAGAKAAFMEVGLFEAFPGMRRIELQIATPRGQMKATMARPASRVQLVR